MENEVLTSTEPTIVESSVENTAVPAENTAVIDNATPMDSNVTYNSLPKTEYQQNMSPIQNMVNEAVQIEHSINQESNAGKAMNQFLTQGYDYDKNEAGSYWVAGAINDNNTQMNFLQTIINEEMYDEMDLQKYYYDTNLATARAYAAQKKKEVAYGFYQAAQQRAYAEGELTGWYMPAEGRYLLGQYTVAQNTLEDPDATVEAKAKASRISKTAEEWFAANQITTRGIKCLAMMNYEENVRHNTVMGELNKQANAIAGSSAAANAAMAELNLKVRKFQLEEEELQRGLELTKALGLDDKDYIGHHPDDYKGLDALRGYGSIEDMLAVDTESYSSVVGYKGVDWVNNLLKEAGIDPTERYLEYSNDQQLAQFNTDISNSNSIKQESFTQIGKKDSEGHDLVYAVVGNEAIVGYFDKGSWIPITDENAKFADNKSIKNFIENRFGEGTFNTEGINAVTIDGTTYSFGVENTIASNTSVKALQEAGYEKYYTTNFQKGDNAGHPTDIKKVEDIMAQSQTTEGIKDSDGEYARNLDYIPEKWESKLVNEFSILKGTNEEGKPQYYSVTETGKLKKVNESDLVDVPSIRNLTGSAGGDLDPREPEHLQAIKSSWVIGYSKENNVTYMVLPSSTGKMELYSLKGNIDSQPTSSGLTIVNNNVSPQEILDAGFKLPEAGSTETAYNSKEMKYNVYNKTENETSKVTGTSTGVSVSPSGKGTEYDPEVIKAIYKEYKLTEEDIEKVKDIRDPEKLKEKIQELHNQVLSMGGEHSGK